MRVIIKKCKYFIFSEKYIFEFIPLITLKIKI